jgi:hypothetical protein
MWMSLIAHQGGVVRAAGVGYSRWCSDRTVAPGAVAELRDAPPGTALDAA